MEGWGFPTRGAHDECRQDLQSLTIDLNVNHVGSAGARLLAQAISALQGLVSLRLLASGNRIREVGARELAQALAGLRQLANLELDVSGNGIGSAIEQTTPCKETLVPVNWLVPWVAFTDSAGWSRTFEGTWWEIMASVNWPGPSGSYHAWSGWNCDWVETAGLLEQGDGRSLYICAISIHLHAFLILLCRCDVRSRSDDEEDEAEVDFVFKGEASAKCNTLIICGPGPASAFAQTMALQPLPWRIEPTEDCWTKPFPPLPKSPTFFQASAGTVVACLDTPVASEYAVAWAERLLTAIGSSQVLYLDRILRAEWCSCSRERPEEPYLAGLWTSSWSGKASIPALPAPNVVEGLAAALLTCCEARCLCIVALTLQDGAHLSEGCLRGFEAERTEPVLDISFTFPGDTRGPGACSSRIGGDRRLVKTELPANYPEGFWTPRFALVLWLAVA
ncbi:unnamed protein product [Effrenium voratum]|nr:unnamed protein product [Effrenium voratum]